MGLRETKKLKTRKLISDLAVSLFISKGFEAVTVAEIAEAAEVAVTTLFNYFPTKESIVFDREDEIDADLVSIIRSRKKGQSVLDCVHRYFLLSPLFNPPNKKIHADFMKLVRKTPELATYYRGLWTRYESTLSREIVRETGVTRDEAEFVARLMLEAVSFASHAPSASSKDVLSMSFRVLKNGWSK